MLYWFPLHRDIHSSICFWSHIDPGSHDALRGGWAGGWRQPRREPRSSVGSPARPASNYPGAPPRGVRAAAPPPRKPERRGRWGGWREVGQWGRGVGGCWEGWRGEDARPPNKRAPGLLPQKQSPAAAGEPRGGAEGGGGGGEGLAQQALSRFIAIKWGPRAAPPED